MSYQVLARKWRPGNFEELVGQNQTARALSNALESQRLHHAYLFTGTRGVGKTTIARIFAKSLNCEKGITAKPCGECASCVEISQGNFVDLLEIDAASKTKVEDTRELLDNVQYRPTKGRYKVYLIDEVHMLSGHSFNALLKTLEEPPPHVVFLLATTDPQKMPVTVLSRCLQFHLRRMDELEIVNHLQKILESESIEFEIEALEAIAKGADGSMRDALSLMDQAIAFCGPSITNAQVLDMLGTIDRAYSVKLLDAIESDDASLLINTINEIAEFSPDFDELLSRWLSLLHQLAVAQATGKSVPENLKDKVESISPADLQLYYQLSLQARKDLAFAPTPRLGFEMAMLRVLAFKPKGTDTPPKKKVKRVVTEKNDKVEVSNKSIELNAQTGSQVEVTSEMISSEESVSSEKSLATEAMLTDRVSNLVTQHVVSSTINSTETIPSDTRTIDDKIKKQGELSNDSPNQEKPKLSVVVDNEAGKVKEDELAKYNDTDKESEQKNAQKEFAANKVKSIIADAENNPLENIAPNTSEELPVKSKEIKFKAEPVEKPTLECINFENWFNVVFSLSIDGSGLQSLLNSLAEFKQNKIHVYVQEKFEPLFTASAREAVLEAVREYFENRQLLIEFDFVNETDPRFVDNETPRERQARLHEVALDEAESHLKSHKQIGYLIENLGAVLPRESIKFIEN